MWNREQCTHSEYHQLFGTAFSALQLCSRIPLLCFLCTTLFMRCHAHLRLDFFSIIFKEQEY